MDSFFKACRNAASLLKQKSSITVFGHRDADGICASVLLKQALSESDVSISIVRHGIDIPSLASEAGSSFPVFVDYGSSEIPSISETFDDFLILDHHPPKEVHSRLVNPWDHGIDGTREMCGSSVVYFVMRALSAKNASLAPVALIGAMGDKQYLSGFSGPNALIVDDAIRLDLARKGSEASLLKVIHPSFGDGFISALHASEILDACASVNKPYVAVDMLLGDKAAGSEAYATYDAYSQKYQFQYDTIINKKEALRYENSQHMAYFIEFEELEPGFSGVLAENIRDILPNKPIIVISKAPYGHKVSARATDIQLQSGIDLGKALGVAAAYVGGRGGGHDVASGATIPENTLDNFKTTVSLELFKQIKAPFKFLLEAKTTDPLHAKAIASSIAVDNGRYKSTYSRALTREDAAYLMILSDEIGTYRNTVDDALVCISSANGVVSVSSSEEK